MRWTGETDEFLLQMQVKKDWTVAQTDSSYTVMKEAASNPKLSANWSGESF